MRIKLNTSMAGDDFAYSAGETVDIDDETAQRLIDKDMAEPVKATRKKAATRTKKED